MTAPRVAIVTPVYNGENFLAETMACVQAIDYPNLVHVVLDNCSTDSTASIIASFTGQRHPLVIARNETTVPMAANWNAALTHVPADADYFWLLCHDDKLSPDSIAKLVAVAESDPEVMIVGCQWRTERLFGDELPKDQSVFDGKEVMRTYFRRSHAALSTMNALGRRSLLVDGKDYYDSTICMFDADALLRACLSGKYGFVHEELAFWRMHDQSTTATISERMQLFQTDWLLLLDRYGSYVMGFREYLDARRRFRHSYLRRLLLQCVRTRDFSLLRWHMRELKSRDDEVSIIDIFAAFADWAGLLVTGRKSRVAAPLRHMVSPHGAGVTSRPLSY
ncbi:MAG: glycosyltransferase family A protein [Caulobacterales bacterium]